MKYYPIGTVVILHGGNRPLMIYGRLQTQETTGSQWDYVGCLYPEGNISNEYTIFFQGEEIAQVFHMGLQCPAETQMLKMLSKSRAQR